MSSAIVQNDLAETKDDTELLDFDAARDTSSWDRADPFAAIIEPISSFGYRVKMADSDHFHTCAIGEQRGYYTGLCTCKGWKYHDTPCVHLCTVRKANFIDAKNALGEPVSITSIEVQDSPPTPDLSTLSDAERNAYTACRIGDVGVREYQRERGYSSPGTVGNLLSRAEEKLEEQATEARGDVDRAQRADAVNGEVAR